MEATLYLAPPTLPVVTQAKTLTLSRRPTPRLYTPKCSPIKATAPTVDNSTVDYSSMTSVFPAEACETIGGDACDAQMYPEVKLKREAGKSMPRTTTSEPIDREYLEYNDSKTVFPGEACDDLGGEFCEPDYQTGVY